MKKFESNILKYKYFLLIILLFPLIVNADSCGTYINENNTNDVLSSVELNGSSLKIRGDDAINNSTSCPEKIYYYSRFYKISDLAGNLTTIEEGNIYSTIKGNCKSVGCELKKTYIRNEEAKFVTSDKYKDMTTCRDVDYDYIKECGCMPAALADLTSRIYMIIKIAAPALLLVIGGFDLIKAMSAQDESAINKARQKLVKKFVAATMVFLLFTLIQFVASAFSGGNTATLKCVDYLLNGYDNVV